MKTYTLSIIIILLLLSACKEYTVKTKVNEDGSIVKTVEVLSRNKITDFNNLVIPLNDSWAITNVRDSSNDVYRLTAKRKFDDVIELINEYGSPGGVVIEVNHAIRGRWFYTYHEYEEIIEAANPFTKLSVKDYLTEGEYNSLTKGELDENLNAKLEKYITAAMMEEFVFLLKDRLREFNINLELIDLIKNDIIYCIDTDDEMACVVEFVAEKYPHLDRQVISEIIEKLEKQIEVKAERVFSLNGDYNYVFDMPGIILSTNASGVEGSSVVWKFSGENFAYVDYRMFAESRVANVGNMIGTGAIAAVLLLLIIFSVVYKIKK